MFIAVALSHIEVQTFKNMPKRVCVYRGVLAIIICPQSHFVATMYQPHHKMLIFFPKNHDSLKLGLCSDIYQN